MITASIRIGTRGSELALWQTNHIAGLLTGLSAEIVVIKTEGDRNLTETFDKNDGKGLFTREIEKALLDGTIDMAVHSLKDLPVESTPGLVIAAITEREDPADIILYHKKRSDPAQMSGLMQGSRIGTSSSRRRAQILAVDPSLNIMPLRGNITTRIRKLLEGQYDAIVLANAGYRRLNPAIGDCAILRLDPKLFPPAPGQGALALQTRSDDRHRIEIAGRLDHGPTRHAVEAERYFLEAFGGGCHVPLGAWAVEKNGMIECDGFIAGADGATIYRGTAQGSDPKSAGYALAETLKGMGAKSW